MHLGLTQLWAASIANGKELPQATAGPAWLSLDELSGTWVGPRGGEQRWTSAVGCLLPVLSDSLTPGGQSEWFGRKDPQRLAFGDSGGSYTRINSTSACRGSVAKIRIILGGGDTQVINFPNSLFCLHYLLILLGPLPLNV